MSFALSSFDFILILIYFIVLLAIGYLSSRKESKEDFLIAKRNLNSWQTMATINASKTGSVLMIFTAFVYLWGISALWYFIGMVVGVLIFIPFAMKLKENSKGRFYTLADYFKHNYGKKIAVIVSLLTIFIMFGYAVLNLIAGAKIFFFFTGWSFWICAIIMSSIVLIYLLLGGFKAVVRTDMLQYAAMVVIMAIVAFAVFKGSIIPVSEWNFFKADPGSIFGFFLIGILFPFAMPDMWQRVYSAKDKKTVRNGMILSAIVYAVVAFLLGLVALTVKASFPAIDPDLALIHGFGNLLPVGLIGLAVVLLFSAIMSSLDTYLFTASSAIIQDLTPNKKNVKMIRNTILILAVLATILAISLNKLVISTYIFVTVILALGATVIATWMRKKIKETTLVTGMIIGLASIGILLIVYSLTVGIQPTLAVIGLLATIIGLFIGGIISKFKN